METNNEQKPPRNPLRRGRKVEDGRVLFVRGIPRALYDSYKGVCYTRGISMKASIEQHMKATIKKHVPR